MLPADLQPGNGRALRRFAAACIIVVPLWWSAMFVASMTPAAPDRIAIDLDGYFLPRYVHGSARLAAEALPLWNAAELSGVPLLGTAQGAVLYPPRAVLFGLLPPLPALHAFMVLHYVLLAVGSFVCLRTLGLGGAGAVFGAVVVTFQPFMLNGHYAPHWISNFAWTPFVLASGMRALAHPSAGAALALALAVSMQVLAGYPEYAFDTLLVLAVLLALVGTDVARERGGAALRRGVLAVAVAAVCTLLVTAVQWVALLETARESVRATGDYEFMFGMVFDRGQFEPGLRGWVDALGLLFYAPPVGWLLVAIGLLLPGLRHRVALAMLAFACFAIPTWGNAVPPFSLFRGPLCWHSILHVPLAALAGAGLEIVIGRRGAGASRWLPVALVVGAVVLCPLLAARAIGWLAAGVAGVLIARLAAPRAGVALVVASALGAAWTWVPAAQASLPHRYAAGQPPYPDVAKRRAEGEALRAACGPDVTGRVLAPRETWRGVPLLAGIRTPQGYPESLAPRYMSALLDATGLAPHAVFPLERTRLAHAGGVLRLLDVQCIVLPADWEPITAALGYRRAAALPDGRVASVRAGSAAFLPATVTSVERDEDALAAVLAPNFDPGATAVVVGRHVAAGSGGARLASVARPAPGSIRVEVSAPDGGYLVVPETWYPGWRARLDGVPVDVERADYAVLGVSLRRGTRTIELWYEPRGFAAARWASAAGVLVLSGLAGARALAGRAAQ